MDRRHHHHHHHRPDPEEELYPPPPRPYPPPYYENEPPPPPVVRPHPYEPPPPPPLVVRHHTHEPPPPPPPHVTHVYHGGPDAPYPPPPDVVVDCHREPPPPDVFVDRHREPPPPVVEHVSHHSHHYPHLPSFFHHHSHHSELANHPSVRVYSKAEPNFSLSIRDGKVILAPSNPSDPFQHWIKDERYSTKVKDEQGFPSFALINRASGQAIKHSIGATKPVQLIPYNPDILDESILWSESKDLGDTFRAIRMVNNIRLNVDAFNGDKKHGGVHDGTIIVLWEWKKGENQRWKIIRY